jgi:hypothetical protein
MRRVHFCKMKTFTIADIFEEKVDSTLGHIIYLVRDETLVFYIGQSKRDVITRFQEHMQKPSRLGKIIKLNSPDSHQWSIDFYTMEDCRPFVQQKSLFTMQAWEQFDMTMAESAMIQALKPVINQDFNPNPTPLPNRYRGHAVIDGGETAVSPPTQNRIWLNKMSLAGWVYEQDKQTNQRVWRHANGAVLTEEKMAPFQKSGHIPPIQ